MKLHRKVRKLLRNPKQFFEDMRLKRFRNLRSLAPKKMEGHSRYTVVSAVYNVGRYLDQYFQSLIDQRLDLQNNITLVMVDDGSTDDSADIILRWQQRYPNNIVYIHKENGGQASARNLGLKHVQTEWVTFIDPDDFVDLNYFLEIDKFLKKNEQSNLQLVSCNFIFFLEDKAQFSNTHPLKYRFSKGNTILPHDNLENHLQLSVNSAVFRSDIILNNSLIFNPKIRPNFEDAHFVGAYLAELIEGHIGFCSQANYFYRKRSDASSTLDTAWQKIGLYDEVLYFGCLDLLSIHKMKSGSVPRHIQRTVLYHLIWYFKRLINKPELADFLEPDQRKHFLKLLDEIFSHIDPETILEFELAGCWFLHKVGILGAFKQLSPTHQIVYIESFDPAKSLVQLRYFTHSMDLEAFEIDGDDVIPVYVKTMTHDFLGRNFVLERRIWLPLPNNSLNAKLQVQIGQTETRLTFAKKQHSGSLDLQRIRQHFSQHKTHHIQANSEMRNTLWLLMDRDSQADDNAEHFYRYVRSRNPTQPIAFVLRRESHDWPVV